MRRDRDLLRPPLRDLGHESQERRGGGSRRRPLLEGANFSDHLVMHGNLHAGPTRLVGLVGAGE